MRKLAERKICKVCENGYQEVLCPECGHNMFYFEMGSDVLVRAVVADNGNLDVMYAVGPNMSQDTEWLCAKCDTEIEVDESFGYGWTDLDGIEQDDFEKVFHRQRPTCD